MLYKPKKNDYTSPASAQGGPGTQKQLGHYFGTPYLNMSAAEWRAVSASIGASLGDYWWLGGGARANGGNAFMFVKNTTGGALTQGQLVTAALPTTGTVTVPGSPVTSLAAVTTNISNVTAGVNGEVDNWLFVNTTGAALPQLRRIKANTAAATGNFTVSRPDPLRPNSPNDQDAFDTAHTNADPCCIIRPYNVIECTATTIPIGVALGAVTAGSYTVIQTAGLALVLTKGDGTALVVNVPAAPAAAGFAIGSAAANLYRGASMILPQFASAAASLIMPCFVNFTGQ